MSYVHVIERFYFLIGERSPSLINNNLDQISKILQCSLRTLDDLIY